MTRLLTTALLFVLLCLSPSLFATPILNSGLPSSFLTLHRGDGFFETRFSFSQTENFFDSNGNQKKSSSPGSPDGIPENFQDFITHFIASYGLADNLSAWIDFPLIMRRETKTLHADDWGIGDVQAGARYFLWSNISKRFEIAFDLSGKFPSGDTDVSFSDPATGHSLQLPLGTGNTDLTTGIAFKAHIHPSLSLGGSVNYVTRFAARVEYLQTSSVIQTSSDGSTTAPLPLGNLKIDWGDEIRSSLGLNWKISDRFSLSPTAHHLYRRPTFVDSFTIAGTGSSLSITPVTLRASSAQLLTVEPVVFVRTSDRISIRGSVDIPLWGKNFPTQTLAFVESLVGIRYSLGVQIAF